MDKKDIVSKIFSDDIELATTTLLDVCYNEDDWRWIQEEWLSLICKTPYSDVKRLAITCLGHLCRINRTIDKEKVLFFLEHQKV